VLFIASDKTGESPIWLASLDGRSAPRQLTKTNGWSAYLAAGHVFFSSDEKGGKFVYRMREDGSDLQEAGRFESPREEFSVSPDGKWLALPGQTPEGIWTTVVQPVGGGVSRTICVGCMGENRVERFGLPGASWSPDGRHLLLNFRVSMYAIPLQSGKMLPPLPASGYRSKEEVAAVPGVRVIPLQGFPGIDLSVYAFTKIATQRNIYRVSVR
jgi:hypothetical protein